MEKGVDIELKNLADEKCEPEQQQPEKNISDEGNDWQEKYHRLAADFANYRNRVSRERVDLENALKADLLSGFLSIYDDFSRLSNHSFDTKGIKEGIQSMQKQWQQWLEENEVVIMQSEGAEFNHDLHEAVLNIAVKDPNLHGKIVQVIENGYLFKDKVLRHAKVAVGRFEGLKKMYSSAK